MTHSQEELRNAFEDIHPQLEKVVEDVKAWLDVACRELGIYAPRIEGRTKEPHSFLLKIIRKQQEGKPYTDPLRQITDKAGTRADVVYANDVDRLLARVRAAAGETFEEITDDDVDDKREKLEADQVGYVGVHVDVTPIERHGLPEELARCEIQIRTNAMAAWAMASHQLVYKPPVARTTAEKRRVNRLTTLLELFDEQVTVAQEAMKKTDEYPAAIVVDALQSARFRFSGAHYDRVLTGAIVTALLPAADAESAEAFARDLDAFVANNEDRLREILSGTRPALVAQPEAILIFLLLDRDRFKVQQAWAQTNLPNALLEDLAGEWGVALPEPL